MPGFLNCFPKSVCMFVCTYVHMYVCIEVDGTEWIVLSPQANECQLNQSNLLPLWN